MFNPFHPKPAPPGFGAGQTVPETRANPLSRVLFSWLDKFLYVGYTRPLQKDDLWTLPDGYMASNITNQVERNFFSRCPPEKRPAFMRTSFKESESADSDESEKEDLKSKSKPKPKKYKPSFFLAVHQLIFWRFWIAGVLRLIADTLKTCTPLVTRLLLAWLTEAYVYAHASEQQRASGQINVPKGIGYGIGLSFAIFAMQEVSSLCTNHSMHGCMSSGMMIRSSVTGVVFRKALRLSGRARANHSQGQITTMISTDTARMERFMIFSHVLWVGPIQIFLGIGLLGGTLGYSALVGVGVLLIGFPIQGLLVRFMFKQRLRVVKATDQRVRLSTEVLNGIRLLKFYAWEGIYVNDLVNIRTREINSLMRMSYGRSLLFSFATLIPVLAAVLSFITYALTGHNLDVAIIFSALQLFNIVRMPMTLFPFAFNGLSDLLVAMRRVSGFLMAEELDEPYKLEYSQKYAVDVDADFQWETAVKADPSKSGKGPHKSKGPDGKKGGDNVPDRKSQDKRKSKEGSVLPSNNKDVDPAVQDDSQAVKSDDEKPFELKDLKLKIPKGSFVAIVGPVGSGKSSILQALVGEMRRTRGEVSFGGRVAYVPQIAWIKNATLRQNITFGQPEDEQKLQEVIQACSLEHDIEILPHGEMTEIGEKGINLSGGQKARISLARAAYSPGEVICMDDPLAAVDAYVGKAILENCLLDGPLSDRTRILVTHSLHVLDRTDYIYVVDKGVIKEQGTYGDLMRDSVVFSELMREYGNQKKEVEDEATVDDEVGLVKKEAVKEKVKGDTLMSEEERVTGAVQWSTYKKYFDFAGGLGALIWAPAILLSLTLTQCAQVGTNLFLSFWTAQSVPGFAQSDYMIVYAMLGVATAAFNAINVLVFAFVSLRASLRLFRAALGAVLGSRVAFFDTTPLGRITSRLSKDQDVLDFELQMTALQFLTIFWSVLGTVALVFYTFPYLGILFVPLVALYYLLSKFYRATSVETKRLDSLMRSLLYAAFGETLTGLATIRAYGEQDTAIRSQENGLDLENRAYYMTISIQRWLSLRLDMFGSLLILGIGLFASGFRTSVNPSKIGLVLSYTLDITQQFAQMVTQYAQNEQNMNAVERILVYTELPPEVGPKDKQPVEVPPSWPEKGAIKFENAEMAYRPGLPLVLKDVSFDIKPGEKAAVTGRTGAGKSSLLQALFRIVELHSGKISIDGRDISEIDLSNLRHQLALVPQDTTLFLGTLRRNIDPLGTRTDAELISVLQRAWLLPKDGVLDSAAEAKFSLDAPVGDEGSNYSVGEKQLLALSRALVKNSRVIVLDEATSSVDVETDAKIQRTIQTEFATSTLICVAHRLNTIAYYDRIIVMDNGEIAEFDTVLNLFDREDGIFRSLCNEANLGRDDILKIRAEHEKEMTHD